jgi:hydrogenase maturation protein HypF
VSTTPERWLVRVNGVVQGVGFRPFVVTAARSLHLTGHVGNDADGVFLEAQGAPEALRALVDRLRSQAPPLAVVESVEVTRMAAVADLVPPGRRGEAAGGFGIVASLAGGGSTTIPPDTATCAECLREVRDPADRRFGYPFIACTHCGPRYTITTGLPYDRDRTTMVDFPLCPDCLAEYTDPTSRRFHAQPTACPRCGPSLSMPVAEVAAALSGGAIVALKGLGGYHLACSARDPDAVARLRTRKQRGAKPFAVMAADAATAGSIAHLDAATLGVLAAPSRPIVIAPARDAELAGCVAPGTGTLGVMLPHTALHHLLFDAGAPPVLVMTSGNLAEEPICIDPDEATQRLAGIADLFCHHDRRIHVACDDSVLRVAGAGVQPVRRSRGFAPLPVPLPVRAQPMVAVGGELKATACAALGGHAWLSQHIGDTANLETLTMLGRTVDTLCALQQVDPQLVVSDAHPGYLSRQWAAQRAAELGVPHVLVQHHHAHLASLLAEHGVPADIEVLGLVLDGTGYGPDATIWGGELLVGSYRQVRRVGHLRPISLPGGDAAIRHPARSALAHLSAAGLPWEGTASAQALSGAELAVLRRMLTTGSHCTPTTSMGRLFDAVASLLGVRHDIDYEAQAAIELEAAAAGALAGGQGDPGDPDAWQVADASAGDVLVTDPDGSVVIDPSGWIGRAVADHAAGVPVGRSARAFHSALAGLLVRAAVRVCRREGVATVGLTGGVFSNAVLLGACQEGLRQAGLRVLVHGTVPANDGGLSLGQVAVAAAGGGVRGSASDRPGAPG